MFQNFSLQVCFYRTTSVRNIQISDCVHTVKTIVSYNASTKLTKMSDNSINLHFSGVRFICFARADNGKMRAENESYALKMNIIIIL